jgi:hypothetical protein
MPDQAEHDKPENLVEESEQLERDAARNLNQAADSHATLDGYYAMNNARPSKELEEEAAKDRQERLKKRQAAP